VSTTFSMVFLFAGAGVALGGITILAVLEHLAARIPELDF